MLGGGGGYAKIFYGLENITRPANYIQLTCSVRLCLRHPWFDANISLLKSSKNDKCILTNAELVISVDFGVVQGPPHSFSIFELKTVLKTFFTTLTT